MTRDRSFRRITAATVIVLLLGAVACSPDSSEPVNSTHLALSAETWTLGAEPELEIGADPDLAEPLFQIVDVRRLAGDTVVVADGLQRVVVFDESGSHVRTIGRRGSGPAEFQSIDWIDVRTPDSLFVYDGGLARVSVFSLRGELAHTVAPALKPGETGALPVLHGRFPDGTYLSSVRRLAESPAGNTGIVRPTGVLRIAGSDGSARDSVGVVAFDEVAILQGVVARLDFLRRTTVRVAPPGFYIATGDDYRVDAYRRDGILETTLVTDHLPAAITESYIASSRLPAVQGFEFPPVFPAVRTFLLDDLGYIWVEEYVTDEGVMRRWGVFSPDARCIGDVLITPEFRPLHIQSDRVTGVWTDSLGIETIRIYRLDRSGT
jgi:hypothetical protein